MRNGAKRTELHETASLHASPHARQETNNAHEFHLYAERTRGVQEPECRSGLRPES